MAGKIIQQDNYARKLDLESQYCKIYEKNLEAKLGTMNLEEEECGKYHFAGRESINFKADLELDMHSCMVFDNDNVLYTHRPNELECDK